MVIDSVTSLQYIYTRFHVSSFNPIHQVAPVCRGLARIFFLSGGVQNVIPNDMHLFHASNTKSYQLRGYIELSKRIREI